MYLHTHLVGGRYAEISIQHNMIYEGLHCLNVPSPAEAIQSPPRPSEYYMLHDS